MTATACPACGLATHCKAGIRRGSYQRRAETPATNPPSHAQAACACWPQTRTTQPSSPSTSPTCASCCGEPALTAALAPSCRWHCSRVLLNWPGCREVSIGGLQLQYTDYGEGPVPLPAPNLECAVDRNSFVASSPSRLLGAEQPGAGHPAGAAVPPAADGGRRPDPDEAPAIAALSRPGCEL